MVDNRGEGDKRGERYEEVGRGRRKGEEEGGWEEREGKEIEGGTYQHQA